MKFISVLVFEENTVIMFRLLKIIKVCNLYNSNSCYYFVLGTGHFDQKCGRLG